MNQYIKQDIRAMTLLDRIQKLEFGDNFVWAYSSGRVPLEIEFDVMRFIDAESIGEAINEMSQARNLLSAYNYNPINAKEANKLVEKINANWHCRH